MLERPTLWLLSPKLFIPVFIDHLRFHLKGAVSLDDVQDGDVLVILLPLDVNAGHVHHGLTTPRALQAQLHTLSRRNFPEKFAE